MALTADREYKSMAPTEELDILAGAADTLYKGAILAVGVDGLVKVAADVADEVPLGICKDQVVAAGGNTEHVILETGRFLLPKMSTQIGTVAFAAGAANNADYNGFYFTLYNGTTKYYVWFQTTDNAPAVDPAVPGATGLKVEILAADLKAAIAGKAQVVIDGDAAFICTVLDDDLTITAVSRGGTLPFADGTAVKCTVANTQTSRPTQADIGTLFYALADDGVNYLAEVVVGANHALGRCIGIDLGSNSLWIDTRQKANN